MKKFHNLTSEGQKYPPEVRVQHETCSTVCGTHVKAILDQKNLTGLAGGVREGQNMAHLGHFNGKCAKMHIVGWSVATMTITMATTTTVKM